MTDLKSAYPLGAAGATQQPRSNMMLIAVAIGCGLLTALISTIYISRISAQTRAKMITVWELRAAVEAGETLKADRLLVEARKPQELKDAMGTNLVTDRDTLKNYDGRPFTRSVRQGAPLMIDMFDTGGSALDKDRLSPTTAGAPLVINSRATPGILNVGMYINILGTFTEPGRLPTTKLVMEKVKVVAVGTKTEEGGSRGTSFGNITVEVDPEVGQHLVTIARHIGKDGFDVLILNPQYQRKHTWDINPEVKKMVGLQ